MEIESQKEDLTVKEQVMKFLLSEWRQIDERFILEGQKKLYKHTFQQYQAKQGMLGVDQLDHLGSKESQVMEQGTQGKGGEK